MATLHLNLRNLLEKAVLTAREEAERAARAALERLAVHQEEPFSALSPEEKALRVRLRAEARRLGDPLEKAGKDQDPFPALVAECAYEQWHRMLFARFLAENNLLMHPTEHVPVTLDDCDELAAEEGEPDAWMVAARYAAATLPGIFRNDDPILQVRFAAEGRQALERLLNDLPPDVFTAEDSLGWVYQFYQARRKKEVNNSGRKIGGADIAPVTQLFTEPYMVQFLLHNSLGAWWVARHDLTPRPPLPMGEGGAPPVAPPRAGGQELPPRSRGGLGWGLGLDYLRLKDDGTPAAGGFPGWPDRAADLRILDPCCGSGHFLVAAFDLLRRMRMIEEGLSEAEAGDAVLRDNLFGLELDPRCTQIAAFNLALAAWKAGGYRTLPLPHVACCGLAVGGRVHEWTQLAGEDKALSNVLFDLYHLFKDAPDLGSLIDPNRIGPSGRKPLAEPEVVIQKLTEAIKCFGSEDDPAASIFGITAQGVFRAAELLTRKYHLVVTNVPYLARGKQDEVLRGFLSERYADAKADLATASVERCLSFCTPGGSTALVTPQNWLFLGSYKKLREHLLKDKTWNVVARLGPCAFETISGEVVNVALFILTSAVPADTHILVGLDASAFRVPAEKADLLRCGFFHTGSQSAQLKNPDARIALEEVVQSKNLAHYSTSYQGICTGDYPRFGRDFWEIPLLGDGWVVQRTPVATTCLYGGCHNILLWENGTGVLYEYLCERLGKNGLGAWVRGVEAWNKGGVMIGQMRHLPASLYMGECFDNNVAVIVPNSVDLLPVVWAFCTSPEYSAAVRRIDQSLKVTNQTLLKVPFDLERWQKVAEERGPLPEPHSDDPTQWLFHGHPARATDPLQVAVARLLGYRWPEHGLPPTPSGRLRQEEDGLDVFADRDGIVCLPAVTGEPPAAERLRALLAAAFNSPLLCTGEGSGVRAWSPAEQERLLTTVDFGGKGLDDWLRDGFFAQHCKLFHNRPFIWHIWDGRKDGFSALVNSHRLDRARLERLIYTTLGAWINAQREADNRGEPGANARLVAALDLQEKLKAILEGEPPCDIYVRWKPLHQQPLGWEPDLNDGVRLNIRPFVTAGVLRAKFTIHYKKDRGTNPDGSERLNDLHVTRAQKEAARRTAQEAGR